MIYTNFKRFSEFAIMPMSLQGALAVERATGALDFLERLPQQRRAVRGQGPVGVTRKRREVSLSRSANLAPVAMRRSCLVASAHSAIIDVAIVLCGVAPENRHRVAQEPGAAGHSPARHRNMILFQNPVPEKSLTLKVVEAGESKRFFACEQVSR